MKNLLRVLLLVLCCCLVFTACDFGINKNPDDGQQEQEDKFTKESVEADPLAAIFKAMGNTASHFITDDAQINETLGAAMLNGSFGVDLNNATILGAMQMTDAQLEIHSRESGEAVFAIKGETADGQKIDSYIYITNEKLAVGSEFFSRIEMDPAYSLTFSDLEDEAWMEGITNLLNEYAGSDETGVSVSTILGQAMSRVEGLMGNAGEGMDLQWLADAIDGLDPTVTEKNGVITVAYELTIDKLLDMAEDIVDTIPDELLEMFTMSMVVDDIDVSMDVDDVRDMLEEGLDQLDALVSQSGVEATVTLKVGLNVETSRLDSTSIKGNVKMNGQKMVDFDISSVYTDTAIETDLDVSAGGTGVDGSIDFVKTTDDTKVEYALTMDVEVEAGSNTTMEVGAALAYTYKKDGNFALEVEVEMPSQSGAQNVEIELNGKVTKTDTSVTISFDELSGNVLPAAFLNIGTIWFDAASELPAFPADATNVKTLTLDQVEALMKKFGMVKPLYGTYASESVLGISGVYHFYGTSYSYEVTFETEDGGMDYDYVHGRITAREDDSITLEYTEWEYNEETGEGEDVTYTNTYTFEEGEGYIKINGITYTVDNSGLEG